MNWKIFGKVHRWLYKLSGGRFGARMGGIDVALLEMVGRKSGKQRTVPLACYPHRDSVLVSASNNGQEKHPAWYLNLQANPRLTVQLGSDRFEVVAEDVPDEEREELWKKVVKLNHHQAGYLANTKRKIPLVFLRRVES